MIFMYKCVISVIFGEFCFKNIVFLSKMLISHSLWHTHSHFYLLYLFTTLCFFYISSTQTISLSFISQSLSLSLSLQNTHSFSPPLTLSISACAKLVDLSTISLRQSRRQVWVHKQEETLQRDNTWLSFSLLSLSPSLHLVVPWKEIIYRRDNNHSPSPSLCLNPFHCK